MSVNNPVVSNNVFIADNSNSVVLATIIIGVVFIGVFAAIMTIRWWFKRLSKAGQRVPIKKDMEEPNALSMGEVATTCPEWQKMGDKYVHSKSLSVHTQSPTAHKTSTVNKRDNRKVLKCGEGCSSAGNRQVGGMKAYYYILIAMSCLFQSYHTVVVYETEEVMTSVSTDDTVYQINDTVEFPAWPEQVYYTDADVHEVSFCRNRAILAAGRSCDSSRVSGITVALTLGCASSIYYNQSASTWTTVTGSNANGLCGAVSVLITNNTAVVLSNEMIRSMTYGYELLKHPTRRRRSLSLVKPPWGSTTLQCYGGGGVIFGAVVVTTTCPMKDYDSAINTLFSSTISAFKTLNAFMSTSKSAFQTLFSMGAHQIIRTGETDHASAEATVFAVTSNERQRYNSMVNRYESEKQTYYFNQNQRISWISQFDSINSGNKIGRIASEFALEIANTRTDISQKVILGTNLCKFGVYYQSNETTLSYVMRASCPVAVKIENATLEIRHAYCVQDSFTVCRCQSFSSRIKIGSQAAVVTDPMQLMHRRWPFTRGAHVQKLFWKVYAGTPPELGMHLTDETYLTLKDNCPAVFVMIGRWGAVVHCGPTCIQDSTQKRYTDQIWHFHRKHKETVYLNDHSIEIPAAVEELTVEIVLSDYSSVLMTAQSSNYQQQTGSKQLLEMADAQRQDIESQSLQMLTFSDSITSQIDSQQKSLQQDIKNLEKGQSEFQASNSIKLMVAYVLSILDLVFIILIIFAAAGIFIYLKVMKKAMPLKIMPNAGGDMLAWLPAKNISETMCVTGVILFNGMWLDADKVMPLIKASIGFNSILPFSLKLVLAVNVVNDDEVESVLNKLNGPDNDEPQTRFNDDDEETDEEEANAATLGGNTDVKVEITGMAGKRTAAWTDMFSANGEYGIASTDGILIGRMVRQDLVFTNGIRFSGKDNINTIITTPGAYIYVDEGYAQCGKKQIYFVKE